MTDRERELRARISKSPEDAEALCELARIVGSRRGEKDEAVELWGRYSNVVDRSRLGEALLALGSAQVEAHREPEAIETLRRCTAEAPGKAEPFDLLGRLLLRAGELEEAVEALRHAIELEPAELHSRVTLIACLDQLGRSGEAQEELDALRALRPGDSALAALVLELIQRRG